MKTMPSDEEARTLEVIEIYRLEHTTWNLERLLSLFTDNPTVWLQEEAHAGKEAVRGLLSRWANSPRTDMEMRHKRVIVQGNLAAVEWETTGKEADGTPIDMAGANVYQMEDEKIQYLHIYQSR